MMRCSNYLLLKTQLIIGFVKAMTRRAFRKSMIHRYVLKQ
jgi:hypothetical protein